MPAGEKVVAVVGPAGCGKTHFYTLLAYHLQRRFGEGIKSAEIKGYVKDPSNRYITFHELLAMLSAGLKLPPNMPPRADEGPYKLYIKFTIPGIFWGRTISIPLIDTGGEIIQELMKIISDLRKGYITTADVEKRMEALGYKLEELEALYRNIFGADVYVYVINTYQMVELYNNNPQEYARVGSSYSNFIVNSMTFRKLVKLGNPKAHAVVFTHIDKARRHLSILNPAVFSNNYKSIASWLANFMLEHFGINLTGARFTEENVFISFTEETPQGDRFRIIVTESGKTSLVYPEEEYDRLIEWLSKVLR